MEPLERLFTLEIEYHRRLRRESSGTADVGAHHTSYALQAGYESLLRSVGPVTRHDIERLANRLALSGDARDVLAARDSVARLFSIGV